MSKNLIRNFINKQQFEPGMLGVFFNPCYISRRSLLREIKSVAGLVSGGVLLDVGCGVRPYEKFFDVDVYYGLDVKGGGHESDSKNCDLFFDGVTLPFEDNSADVVLTTQVVEHVPDTKKFFSEIRRVLKPGGNIIITAPFVGGEHEQPYDFWRFTSFGIKEALERDGFKIKKLIKCETFFESIFQLLSNYFYSKLVTGNRYLNVLVFITICSPVQLIGLLLSKILPANKDLFLNTLVVAERV